ncbi:MAG: hypothetical protein CVU48_05385 [Candidatus Cloacimonetes bacterium HGW-Cloacimonetes-1]|jgi:hypothetical protein|nr:MAG: hypothetical protein CVU48_05385 [Candidatus Cloacimonetes bacterium HGW-Cloacimonetes-1]
MKYISVILLLLMLMLVGCNTVKDEILAPTDETPDAQGYYSRSGGGVNLRYKTVGNDLQCILSANTPGWLSVGFDPSSRMKDANYIIGYVNGGVGSIRDDWGTSQSSHEADVALGGTSDITLLASDESGGITTLEFIIPLNSGDAKDKAMVIGNSYSLIFAKGNADDYDSMHSGTGVSTITIH